jgi:hypothetical protein
MVPNDGDVDSELSALSMLTGDWRGDSPSVSRSRMFSRPLLSASRRAGLARVGCALFDTRREMGDERVCVGSVWMRRSGADAGELGSASPGLFFLVAPLPAPPLLESSVVKGTHSAADAARVAPGVTLALVVDVVLVDDVKADELVADTTTGADLLSPPTGRFTSRPRVVRANDSRS